MRLIAVDTETSLIPPQGTDKVNTRHQIPDLVVTTFSSKDTDLPGSKSAGLLTWQHEEAHHHLFNQDEDVVFVFHNAAFDLAVLSKAFPTLEPLLKELVHAGRVLDTKVMYLLRNTDPTDRAITLARLSQELLGEQISKGDVRTSFRQDQPLSAEQKAYAIKDAEVTWGVADALLRIPLGCIREHYSRVPPQKLIATNPVCNLPRPDVLYSKAAALCAWYLKPLGMAVNMSRLVTIHSEFSQKAEDLRTVLAERGLARLQRLPKVEPTIHPEDRASNQYSRRWEPWSFSPPKLARVWKGQFQTVPAKVVMNQGPIRDEFQLFAKEHNFPPPLSKKTKRVSLARDDWKDWEGLLPTPLKVYMDYQKTNKYLSAFLQPLLDARAKEVKADYWVPGAVTGRWACSKPNLQQVPRAGGIRSIYVPREGHVFVYADYPTLELYTLAHCMSCMGIEGPLLQALRSGDDIHTRTASLMNGGKPLEEVTKEERQAAKAANFGLPGGMGNRRFWLHAKAQGAPWDLTQAHQVRNSWFNAYPDIAEYLSVFRVDAYAEFRPAGMEAREWLERLGFDPHDTWPRSFDVVQKINKGGVYTVILPDGRRIPDRQYSAAANSFFQGMGASIITQAFANCCEADLRVVAVVHDSITVEARDTAPVIEEVRRELSKAMADALVTACPVVPRPVIETEVAKEWK